MVLSSLEMPRHEDSSHDSLVRDCFPVHGRSQMWNEPRGRRRCLLSEEIPKAVTGAASLEPIGVVTIRDPIVRVNSTKTGSGGKPRES